MMFRSLIRLMLCESLGGWTGNQPGLVCSYLLENLVLLGGRLKTQPLHPALHTPRRKDRGVQRLRRLECEVSDRTFGGERGVLTNEAIKVRQ